MKRKRETFEAGEVEKVDEGGSVWLLHLRLHDEAWTGVEDVLVSGTL